jgi:toxin HigB-1
VINRVELGKDVAKGLKKLPQPVRTKLMAWVAAVEQYGLDEVRKVPGYHDEPLKGDRAGQRSVRLSKSWRAFYVIKEHGQVEFVLVQEVNHHDY